MTSTTPPDPAEQPTPADGTPTSPRAPRTVAPSRTDGSGDSTETSSAEAPAAPPKRAPRTTTPRTTTRTTGAAKAPAKRPAAPRTAASADEATGDAPAAKTPAARSTTASSTTGRTSASKTTAAKTTTTRTTAAKRTPAKATPAPTDGTPAESADDAPQTPPKAPRTTAARPAAKTGARTPAAKSTSARTPAKRTPARPSTARTPAAKKAEQTAAAAAGVLDEVRAPESTDESPVSAVTAVEPSVHTAPPEATPDTNPTDAPPTVHDVEHAGDPERPASTTTVATSEVATTTEVSAPTESQAAPVPSSAITHDDPAPSVEAKRPARRPVEKPSAAPAEDRSTTAAAATDADGHPIVLSISGLVKQFGDTVAVDGVDLEVRRGSFYGIVGPNGAGKTTTLSMVTGLLRPDAGSITVQGVDVWREPEQAKRAIGVLPDRLRLFDRLTGSQLLYYSGVLRGLDPATVKSRTTDLAKAFGLDDALGRLVSDYSAGMTKKIALAAALIHSPRVLILDEPFESVDPVSAANVIEILQRYVANGGTVVLSSHGMDFIQRVCDHVAIIVQGKVLAAGSVDEVRGTGTLEERFVELAGGRKSAEGMEWLHSFSD